MSFIFVIITGWLIVGAIYSWRNRAQCQRIIAAFKTPR